MDIGLLKEILAIPTYFGVEIKVKEFLVKYFKSKNYQYHFDAIGNLYAQKGNAEYFPCVCAHMDSVHKSHVELIENNWSKEIVEDEGWLYAIHPQTKKRMGLGADDLAGIYLCLEMFDRVDNLKGAFFIQEEYGIRGARECDENFLKDVGYFIEFDGPTNNWYSQTLQFSNIYSEEFHCLVEDILKRHGITNFSHDPYTDIAVVKDKFNVCSCNLPAGYFYWHTDNEYLDLSHIDNHILLGFEFLKRLGEKRFELNKQEDSIKTNIMEFCFK